MNAQVLSRGGSKVPTKLTKRTVEALERGVPPVDGAPAARLQKPRKCPQCSHTWLVSKNGHDCPKCGQTFPYEVRDSELKGFLVRVEPGGAKTFFLDYRHAGRRNRLKLGTYPNLSAEGARALAKAAAGDVAKGIDLQGRKKAEKAEGKSKAEKAEGKGKKKG